MRGRVLGLVVLLVLAGCVSTGGPPHATSSPTVGSSGDPTRSAFPPTAGQRVTIVDVVDGDTLRARYPNGTQVTLRLVGVDTPEVHTANHPTEFEGVPDTDAGAACLRAEGHDASAFVRSRVLGKQVRVRFDDQAGRRDRYDRLLVYVLLNGTDVNYQLVVEGYARVYTAETFAREQRYLDAETTARNAGRGVWRCRSPTTPTASPTPTGRSTAGLAVVEIHADAAGNDHDNLNDEYLVLENTGTHTLDLSGWTISDAAGHTYTVPDGIALEPGDRVTLYTGAGSDATTELYWGAESAIWNNGGDTITVRNTTGAVVLHTAYS